MQSSFFWRSCGTCGFPIPKAGIMPGTVHMLSNNACWCVLKLQDTCSQPAREKEKQESTKQAGTHAVKRPEPALFGIYWDMQINASHHTSHLPRPPPTYLATYLRNWVSRVILCIGTPDVYDPIFPHRRRRVSDVHLDLHVPASCSPNYNRRSRCSQL